MQHSINFDYTEDEGKELLCIFGRCNLDQWVAIDLKQRKICFAQVTSGSDRLIAANGVRTIKVNKMQNPLKSS
jgi:hypothetical protein